MKSTLCVLVLCLAILFPCPSQAEPIAAGYSCTQMGTSQMADDKSSLVICLQTSPAESTLVWKSMTGGGVPIGAIIAWPVAGNPPDMYYWLDCDGRAITKTDYPILFNMVGNRVPDLRGEFLRGLDAGRGLDIGRTLGSAQEDGLPNITATTKGIISYTGVTASGAMRVDSVSDNDDRGTVSLGGPSSFSFDASRSNPIYGAAKGVQPHNVSVRYLIRARN